MNPQILRFIQRNGGYQKANGIVLLLERWCRNQDQVAKWRRRQETTFGKNWFESPMLAAATEPLRVHDRSLAAGMNRQSTHVFAQRGHPGIACKSNHAGNR